MPSTSVEHDYPLLCREGYLLLTKHHTGLVHGSRGGGLFEGSVGPVHDWILSRD